MDRDIRKRIAMAIDTLCGGNKSEFCRHIGRKADAVKDIVGGKGTAPGFDLIYDILASDLGISPTWLILGDGDMVTKPKSEELTPAAHPQTIIIGNLDELAKILKK